MFLIVPIVEKEENEGKKLEPVSINMNLVSDYRQWKTKDGKKQTVFFFKKDAGKNKLIADIDVDQVHSAIGAMDATKELKWA